MKRKIINIIITTLIMIAPCVSVVSGTEEFYETRNTYVGNINSQLVNFNVGQYNGATYISGEIIVVEWVDGKSTVPEKTPNMKFKSTTGEELNVFVTPTGTNTYYFDRYIEGIDTSKVYYFEVESGDSRNVSSSKSMNVYFNGTRYDNTIVGYYKDKKIRLNNQNIKFEDNSYIGNLNTQLIKFNKGQVNGSSFISGEIVVVEWIDGKSTVPTKTPKMRFVSTDGNIDIDVFVTPTGTNTYYFDRYIEGIDTSKEYKFIVESTDERNVSPNRRVPVYFRDNFDNIIVGKYKDKRIKLENDNIVFTDGSYEGNLNTQLIRFNKGDNRGASYVSGEIVVVEWVDGKSTVPESAPRMRFQSNDGDDIDVFVTPTGTNTYYFDRYIEGIDTTKEYKFIVESTDPANISQYNKVPVYFSGEFNNKIIGSYQLSKMILLEGTSIKFKPLDETYPIIMNQDEIETFNLINQQRSNYGVAPLQIDSRVQMLARLKAEDMSNNNYFSHTSPTYGSPFDMLNKANVGYWLAGENIAACGGNSMAVSLWMNSTMGHRENILNSGYNYTGIGVVYDKTYGKKYVQIFIQKQ